MLISAFFKALRNLTLPDVLKLLLICLAAYAVAGMGLVWLFSWLIGAYTDLAGAEGFFAHLLAGAGGIVLAWFMFPLLYPILIGFFDEKMASVIERADYPDLPKAEPPFWPTLMADVWFSLKAIALNIICLPLYIVPFLGIFVYYGMNGYLLGTQFFRMAAGLRASPEEAESLRRRAQGTITLAGVLISFCATIPVLNFAAPVLGVATMLHLFHALRASGNGAKG